MAGKFIRLRDGRLHTFERMEMMGIINVTPDSFFAGSRAASVEDAVRGADEMMAQGAVFLDIGGESTRPGSDPVTGDQEIERVCPAIRAIREKHPEAILSVDTYRAATARAAVEAGADIINDISAMTFDRDMARTAAELETPIILMHINGTPDHMQDHPHYDDVAAEVHAFLEERIAAALEAGVAKDRIIIDLGIGFGKTFDHNMTLLREIDRFDDLGMPHLLAVSRKTFIGKLLGEEEPADRLAGTCAVTAWAAAHGIEMARVHDVRPNLDAARMTEALMGKDG